MSGLSKDGHLARITEQTLIPLSLLMVFCGGVFWFTVMYAQVNANSTDIKEMKIQNVGRDDKLNDKLSEMNGRLSNIEGALGVRGKRAN